MRAFSVLVVVFLAVVAAGPATAVGGAGVGGPDSPGTFADPADPESDVLGWENGYWYNESVSVDRSDGLNETELDAVVARAMARVERIRGLEFQEDVPVEIVSREQYRERNAGRFNTSAENRLHQNVKFEALFMVGESTDAVAVQQSNLGSSVLGLYSPESDQILIVSENTTAPKMNEITLAQELFHALQDQHFNLSSYEMTTEEDARAVRGIIEGDGNFVDYLYERRCRSEWQGTCLLPEGGSQTGGGDVDYGLLYYSYQPYSDGPAFVRDIYEEEGWEGVNAVYDRPPASTEQVIHPEKYREDAPTNVTVENRSTGAWHVLEMGEGSVNYASFGEAGLFTMLLNPAIETRGQSQIIPIQSFYSQGAGQSSIDPFNYSHPYTAGWDGDRLLPYVTNDSASTNETGYVWKIAWDSPRDAEQFVEGYRQLLAYHDAERVGAHTYRIPDGSPYADAFHVNVSGDLVTVVNAPTVEDLSMVRSSVTVEEGGGPTLGNGTGTAAETTTGTGGTATSDDERTTTDAPQAVQPGFTPGVALVALAAAAILALARRGRAE